MDTTDLFPVCPYYDSGKKDFYYPYGNTPAEDFLENIHPNCVKSPDILVLGCGDIRSCFYTVWKHFTLTRDPNNPSPFFSGVHFVLNDHSAAVLARNIILLYLCMQKPSNIHSTDFNQWLCALWAIWFSKNLYPDHKRVLDSALKDLLHYSTVTEYWASKDNPLSSLVQFSSECTLKRIHNLWKMWLTFPFNKKEDDKQFVSLTISTSEKTDIENLNGMAVANGLPYTTRKKMESEINNNYSTGNSFAEYVVGKGQILPVIHLVANVTMHERIEDEYIMDSSIPFRCFHHAFKFSPSELRLSCSDSSLLNQLIVSDEKFQEYPLLANSVQQLALWLSCTSTLTSTDGSPQQKACIKFTFNCSDAIQFCNELQNGMYKSQLSIDRPRFDVVYTSNLFDPLHPPNVVLFAMPLLKSEGFLFTTTMKYKLLAQTTHDYIEMSFGIASKMFPLLFGIRCINHESDEYKSPVSIKPVPVETNAICPRFTPYYPKVMIWEKVPSMLVQNLSPGSNLWHVLYTSVTTILTVPLGELNTSSSLTAVKMLQTFLVHVNGDDTDSTFWKPFCSLLKYRSTCKHLLQAVQTHSILSGLHLHLLVTDKTCPFCNNIPILNFFGQISVNIQPLKQFHDVQVYAQVYESAEHKDQYSTFDCLASHKETTHLKLSFIVPLYLCESNHYVKIVTLSNSHAPEVLKDGQLKSFLGSKITYSFSKSKPCDKNYQVVRTTTLGSLQSHYGNGDTFESVIALSEDGYSTYSRSKNIHHKNRSDSKLALSCGVHKFDLCYPHPIDFNSISIKISRSRKTLTVVASRKRHEFTDEKASLFFIYPDRRVTLPQLNVVNIVLKALMGMQKDDFETQFQTGGPPLTDLKNILNALMQEKQTFFTYADPSESVYIMIIVINRVFDYQVKAPAIDLIYGVTTNKSVMMNWLQFTSYDLLMVINRSTIELMEKAFLYFSRRTISISTPKTLLKVKRKVDDCFKRAVVYPLYGDPDDNVRNSQVPWSEIKSNPINSKRIEEIERMSCTFCGRTSVDMYTCEICLVIRFCGKCKIQHFSSHKALCDAKESGTTKPLSSDPSTKCNYCCTQSSKLMRCSNCRSVQYCSQECQKGHWKVHKTQCKYVSSINSESDQAPLHSKIERESESPSKDIDKCVLCHKRSGTLKACSNCLDNDNVVKYCSKECQRRHWSEHKKVCKQQAIGLNKSLACSYCSKASSSLKQCTLCHTAQYCDKECQTKHWKIHKPLCKSEKAAVLITPKETPSVNTKPQPVTQKCSFCSRQAQNLKKCTRCHNAQYCNTTCQQRHWASHKKTCKSVSSQQ